MEVLIGLIIGFAIGATGVGGGTLTAPALILILRFSPRMAIATALVFSAVVKIGAAVIYLWRKQVNFRVLGYLLAGGLPGVLLGAVLFNRFNVRRSDGWIIAVIGVLVMVSAGSSLLRFYDAERRTRLRLPLLPFFGLPIGFETGFSSAGAGALGSVVLLNISTLTPAAVVGTDLLFGMITSAAGGAVHIVAGNCDWTSLAILVPAGFAGAIAGVRFAHALPAHKLRRILLLWAGCVGSLLVYKGLISN